MSAAADFVRDLVQHGLARGILRLEVQVPFARGEALRDVYSRRGPLSEADRGVLTDAAEAVVGAFTAEMKRVNPRWGLTRFERSSMQDFVLFMLQQQLKEARDDKFRAGRIDALLAPLEGE